jgi:hypothetical protein
MPIDVSARITTTTRLKITSVPTRVQKAIWVCTRTRLKTAVCNVLLIAGKACNKLPAYGRRKACNPAGLRPVINTNISGRLPGKAEMARVQYAQFGDLPLQLIAERAQFGDLLLQLIAVF